MKLLQLLLLGLSACIVASHDGTTGVTEMITSFMTEETGMTDRVHKRVCYYNSMAQHREGDAKCLPEDINPTLCSHLTLAYANISMEHTLVPTDPKDIETGGVYEKIIKLKEKESELKVLLAFGGRTVDMDTVKEMLKTEATQLTFITSVIKMLKDHRFDGISVDLVNVSRVDGPHLTNLVKVMHEKFIEESKTSGKPVLVIALTIPGKKENIDVYELSKLQSLCSFINVETYNLVEESDPVTAHHSALFPNPNLPNAENNTLWVAKYVALKGVPKNKLILGMPLFARTWKLQDANIHGLGAPTVGLGPIGKCINEEGYLCYFEYCQMLKDNKEDIVPLPIEKVSYVHKNTLWVAFDDQTSLTDKVEWLKKEGYGGWMVSMIDNDDFNGKHCHQGSFPLIRTLYETLIGGVTGTVTPLTEILTSATT